MTSRTLPDEQRAARAYLSRGWCAIPVPGKSKNPNRKRWEAERYEPADVPHHFPEGINIGIHCGAPSGGLVDVDLDSPEARSLAPVFLPPTERIHGRPSSPDSHWWYQCDPAPEKVTRYKAPDRTTLVELRSTGGQTIVPPSVHPDGERLAWSATGEPAVIDGRILKHQVEKLAACALLARHWTEGSRHDLALAMAGTLLRNGWDVDEAWSFIEAASRAAGDIEQLSEHRHAVYDTLDALNRDDPATGIPTLIEILTEPVATRILRWLGLELQRVRLVTPSRVAKPTNGKHEPEPEDIEPVDEDEPEWAIPSDAPAVEIPDLPYWLNRIVRHIEPYTPMFPPDWPVMMSLPFWSILWPNVRIQNLNLAVWTLGLAPQGGGKNVGTDELKAILQTVSDRNLTIYTAGSPEGMWDSLEGVGKQLLAYHDEYAGYLKLLNRDHMSYAKEALCGLYDGRGVGYLRAQKKGVTIQDPIVAVCATTTARAFRDHADVEDMFNGYLSRFLFCVPDYRAVFPDTFRSSQDADREQLIRDLVDFHNRHRGVTRLLYASTGTSKDPELIRQFREHHGMDSGRIITPEESMDDRSIPPGRLLARIKKIAGLFALAEESPTMSEGGRTVYIHDEHIEAATVIVERGRFYATRALAWIGENEEVRLSDRVMRLLLNEPRGLTRRDLCRKLHAKSGDIRNALDLLRDAGQAVSERQETSRAERWFAVRIKGKAS